MKLCKNVSNDGQYHVDMNYDVGMSAFILDRQRGERCSPRLFSDLLTPALIAWSALSTRDDLTEVSRYYPEFPECWEIKRMRKQWIPGPFLRFFERAWVRGYKRACEISSINHANECQELIKMMFTTLGCHIHGFQNVWCFPIFLKIWQVRTCKIFQFLGNHGTGDLSTKNTLSQPWQCQSLLIIMWPLLEVVWMVSNGFEIFLIFRQTCSFWPIIELVSYPAPITLMNVRTLSRWCLLLLDGIAILFKMFDGFQFFVKFDRSGHANFFYFLWNHGTGDLSIKNALNQPYQCHSLLIIMWPL